MKKHYLSAFLLIAGTLSLVGVAVVLHKPVNGTIVDVSWPNCHVQPESQYRYGVVGVTGGLDFRPNPCISKESSWFEHYALYMNTGYPGAQIGKKFQASPLHCSTSDNQCLAYNYGYGAALYAIRYASIQGVHANMWWLDVETDNSWTANFLINRAVLEGAVMAVRQNVLFSTVGFYAAPDQWNELVGQWQTYLPAWIGTGGLTENTARQACQNGSFTGGMPWLGQYTQGLDKNVPCSSQFTHYVSLVP